MKRIARMRPSPAMIVAMLALIVALGGSSYAAVKLKKNSVGPKQLKKDAVTNPKVANAAIGSAEVADGAIGTAKVANGAIGSAQVADGALTRADSARGVLVNAYGRINDGAGAPTVAAGAVNVTAVSAIGGDGDGTTRVSIDPAALPGGSVATCTVFTTPVTTPANGSLGFFTADVAVNGSPLLAAQVEVQTRTGGEALADSNYYIQVSCPPG